MSELFIQVGEKYNSLTVLQEVEPFIYLKPNGNIKKIRRFLCLCKCGNETEVRLGALRSGHSKTCGCSRGEKRNTTDRESLTRLYRIYQHMLQRCDNPNDSHFKDYGAKGIKVSKQWQTFPPFKKWALDNGYNDKLEIYRVNEDGDFSPENCKLVTRRENVNNRKNTLKVLYKGAEYALTDLLREKGIEKDHETIRTRLKRGWSHEKAIDTPIAHKVKNIKI